MQRRSETVCCFFKRETQRGLNICTALWSDTTGTAASTTAAEHLTEDVTEIGAARIEAHAATGETS
jgi:hypothetical protein